MFILLVMGLWSKVKGVFGRIGSGLKDYIVRPVVSLASKIAAPVGAAIGSVIPGVGTAAGGAIGGVVQGAANGISRLI